MKRITVVPPEAADLAHSLLDQAGWKAARIARDGDGDREQARAAPGETAIDVVRRGDPALYVPELADTAALRRILVVHEGSRGDRAGMLAADEAAVASGAEIVVLHIPPSKPSTTSASLPFRIADHGTYDWAEWRDEFLRRFCRCSPGVRVTLHVSAGGRTTLRNQLRDEKPDLVILSGPARGDSEIGEVQDVVLGGQVPVLLVPSVGRERAAREQAELGQHR
jgi:hypothetical protein